MFFLVQFVFLSNSKRYAPFHCTFYDYPHADWDALYDHLRDVPWEDVFKVGCFVAAAKFCEWFPVGLDVYIPHHEYQVKPHSSPWLVAALAAAIAYQNHFHLYQQNKSSGSNVKFLQTYKCERVLEAAKLVYANKTNKSTTSQKLGSGKLLIVF